MRHPIASVDKPAKKDPGDYGNITKKRQKEETRGRVTTVREKGGPIRKGKRSARGKSRPESAETWTTVWQCHTGSNSRKAKRFCKGKEVNH